MDPELGQLAVSSLAGSNLICWALVYVLGQSQEFGERTLPVKLRGKSWTTTPHPKDK